MASISARGGRRRAMSEMNMVPFIDVMLVLLIIFMVTAPLITTGLVDIPTVGKSPKAAPTHVVEVVVSADGRLRVRVDQKGDGADVRSETLVARVRDGMAGATDLPVIISADKGVKYESVVKVMSQLQVAGFSRVGLMVKGGGG
jgi:biopolymer transport protein TolR